DLWALSAWVVASCRLAEWLVRRRAVLRVAAGPTVADNSGKRRGPPDQSAPHCLAAERDKHRQAGSERVRLRRGKPDLPAGSGYWEEATARSQSRPCRQVAPAADSESLEDRKPACTPHPWVKVAADSQGMLAEADRPAAQDNIGQRLDRTATQSRATALPSHPPRHAMCGKPFPLHCNGKPLPHALRNRHEQRTFKTLGRKK